MKQQLAVVDDGCQKSLLNTTNYHLLSFRLQTCGKYISHCQYLPLHSIRSRGPWVVLPFWWHFVVIRLVRCHILRHYLLPCWIKVFPLKCNNSHLSILFRNMTRERKGGRGGSYLKSELCLGINIKYCWYRNLLIFIINDKFSRLSVR